MHKIFTLKIILFLDVLYAGAREKLDDKCDKMANVKWDDVCFGTITSEIKLKYKDQMTSIGTPFKVMISSGLEPGFLVTFYDSFLLTCNPLHIDENSVATCAKKGNYTIKPSMVYCFEYPLFYVSELMQVCFDPADYNMVVLPVEFVVLHYAYTPPHEAGQIALHVTPKRLLFIFVTILVWMM